jgi:hypothetical protein
MDYDSTPRSARNPGVLTPERERDVERLVKESKGPSAAARASAARELAKLGRFAAPAQKKAEERLARRR